MKRENVCIVYTCIAHECDPSLYMEIVAHLVTIAPPPLTDDTGSVLATRLLNFIIKRGNLNQTFVRNSLSGTYGTVRYLLRMPSGKEYIYSGWPDFQVFYTFSQEEMRIGGRESMHNVCAVG